MQFFDRRRITSSSVVFLVFLSACSNKAEPPKETSPTPSSPIVTIPSVPGNVEKETPAPSAIASISASAPEVTIHDIDPETVSAVLVWQKDPKVPGAFRSQWVEKDGDKPKLIAERPGILFWSSNSLWTLETTIVKGCSLLARNDQGDVLTQNGVALRGRSDMQMPELARISDGFRVAPWKDGHGYPYSGTQCDPALEDYSISVTVEGGMGPFVVVREKTYVYAGGAHGFRGEDVFAIDLDKREKAKLAPKPEDGPALLNNAAKGLFVKPAEVHDNGVLLLYGPNGTGLAIYRYFASASYADGTGGNSYSNDFEVSSKNLPPDVAGFGKLPTWALPLLKPKAPPIFMIPPARKDLFKSQFDAAYANAKSP